MHFLPSQADSWFNLPRRGGVAYAAQESWVQSATIKENIIFGAPYDEERYKKGKSFWLALCVVSLMAANYSDPSMRFGEGSRVI